MSAVVAPTLGFQSGPPADTAPTIFEQLAGVFTEPVTLFRRLARNPRWGQALWVMIAVGCVMMTFWALKVDVDAMQRPLLERNGQLSASQIDQTIDVSRRFILPMAFASVMVRNLFGVLGTALVFWLFALAMGDRNKPGFLHAVSAASVPNLVLAPYMLMIGVVCLKKPFGGSIPERVAPSGLAYYLRPENPKIYGLLAQVDPFIIGYYVMLFLAVRYTMRLKPSHAAMCTALTVILTVCWKVYFWV